MGKRNSSRNSGEQLSEDQRSALTLRNEAILALVPDIIVEVDNNKIYQWSNAAGYEFFGDDIIGKNADYYFVGNQETISTVQSLFEGDENILYLESWQRRKDGVKRLLAWWCRVLKSQQGEVIGVLSTARDITQQRLAEDAARELNELNKLLFQTIPFGLDIIDESGTILYVNDILAKQFPGKIIGKKCWDTYRDDHVQFRECPLFEGITVGQTKTIIAEGLFGKKTFQIIHTGMLFHGNKVILEVFQDITEKIEVEKKVMLLAHTLENVAESVSITDIDDRIIYVNDSFMKTYGYSENELLGKHISVVRPSSLHQNQLGNILFGTIKGGWKGEVINQKRDGSQFPILLSTSVIKDDIGKPLALIGVATDISEIKKTQEELIAAKEKAEHSDRLKSEFLANISHEIRNPMNGILGFANLLKAKDLSTERRNHFLEVITSSSQQLLSIISDIVEISKIETHQVEVVKSIADINRIIDDIYNNFLIHSLAGKRITMTADKPSSGEKLFVNTDEVKLKQVLSNLVENAIKFTTNGSIQFGYKIHPGSEIEFFVKDTGVGISRDHFDLIFDRFRKIENKDIQLKSGSGLGLAISKSYVELLGGRIWLESEQGKGTTFYFTIPFEPELSGNNQNEVSMESMVNLSELTILIAEDDVSNFYLIREYLSGTSVKIIHAWDGEEAILKFKSNPSIGLILMDIRMPKMDGYEATAEIRKFNETIPIIAQTGFVFEEDKQKARTMGFDGYLCKPINESDLLAMVRKHLKVGE